MNEVLIAKRKKKAACLGVICTLIYTVLFPLFVFIGILFLNLLPGKPTPIDRFLIFLAFLNALSLPVAIYLIWSTYAKGQYEKIASFCRLPIFTTLGWFLIGIVLAPLART
jgi:hypothetical protein